MGGNEEHAETQNELDGLQTPRDLIDFYQRWPDFRPAATGLAGRADLSAPERQTLQWLILLVDRISEHDVLPLKPSI
jgi:hypothetical protein